MCLCLLHRKDRHCFTAPLSTTSLPRSASSRTQWNRLMLTDYPRHVTTYMAGLGLCWLYTGWAKKPANFSPYLRQILTDFQKKNFSCKIEFYSSLTYHSSSLISACMQLMQTSSKSAQRSGSAKIFTLHFQYDGPFWSVFWTANELNFESGMVWENTRYHASSQAQVRGCESESTKCEKIGL